MNIENKLKLERVELKEGDEYPYHGKLLRAYPCGCHKWEYGQRGFCPEHWYKGYFAGIEEPENRKGYSAGIEEPENKIGESPERIEDDFTW